MPAVAARAPYALPLRRSLVRRPELWLYGVALVAWLALALGIGATAAHRHHASWLTEWRGWAAMVLATMLPVVAPNARRIAMRSLWHRRHRAIAWFVLGYLAVWLLVGVELAGVLVSAGRPHPGPAALAVALLAAAAWQVAPPRRRAMLRCGTLRPCAPRGRRADRDCAHAGVVLGLRCTFTCGPVMLAMALAHSMVLMAGLLALLLSERARGPNPERRAGRPLEAWCLVGFAALAGVAALT